MNYSSPKELAKYLMYLVMNKTAYNSYFNWKKHVKFDDLNNRIIYNYEDRDHHQQFCEMCIKLHLDSFIGNKKETILDLNKYWNQKSCISKSDLKFSLNYL